MKIKKYLYTSKLKNTIFFQNKQLKDEKHDVKQKKIFFTIFIYNFFKGHKIKNLLDKLILKIYLKKIFANCKEGNPQKP